MNMTHIAAANDGIEPALGGTFPADAVAVISCPALSVVSAGRVGTGRWLLEFAPRSVPFIDPLMGWTGGSDTLRQVRLRFPTCAAAVAYAERQGLRYEVREPSSIQWPRGRGADDPAASHLDGPPLAVIWAWEAPHLVSFDDALVANDNAGADADPSSDLPHSGQAVVGALAGGQR